MTPTKDTVLDKVLGIFSDDIEVNVSPDLFTLRCKERSLALRTVVHLSNDGSTPRFLGAGDGDAYTEPTQSVELFRPGRIPAGIMKGDCLEAFFRYAVMRVSNRWAIVRPRLFFSGVDSLQEILGGYQEWILKEIGESAGARACYFEHRSL